MYIPLLKKTPFVNQNIIRGASKIGVSLEITNTDFIKKVIAEYAKGDNCTYSNNL